MEHASTSSTPDAFRSQDIDSLAGKILRVNDDGTAPTDNPFYDGTNSNRSKVWLYGLRNPYRLSLDATTGELYLGDLGWNTWEEVDRGVPGGNFGWPCFEGPIPTEGYSGEAQCVALPPSAVVPPLITYPHSAGDGTCVVGGVVYSGTAYPEIYRGRYFFVDYSGNWIKQTVFDSNGTPISTTDFARNVDVPVSLDLGPDGNLYYVSFTTGQIVRIRYNGPTAVASATPTSGYSPLQVAFSSQGSAAPGGGSLSYLWDFGDHTTSTAANPTHTYAVTGVATFVATLTVTDANNQNSSATTRVTVGSLPPVPTILTPSAGTVSVGQTIPYSGSATDPDDGEIPPSGLSWTILLHHNTHVHTFVGSNGPTGSFVAVYHGLGDYAYELILTATDSSGLTASTSVLLPVAPDTQAPGGAWAVTGDGRKWADSAGMGRGQRQRSGDGLPRGAVCRGELHELRPDRHGHGDELHRRGFGGAIDVHVSRAGGRRGGEPWPVTPTRPAPRRPPRTRRHLGCLGSYRRRAGVGR